LFNFGVQAVENASHAIGSANLAQ